MSLTMTVERDGRFPVLDWPAAAAIWTERSAPLGQDILRARAPFRTGAMRGSIDERREISPGLAIVMFYSQIDYMKYVLNGTGPHVIRARNAKTLRWVANSGHGPVRFAKSVNHPGTKANDFPVDAMRAIGPAVSQLFADAVRESLRL